MVSLSFGRLRHYLASLATLAGGVANLPAVGWALLTSRGARRRPFLVRLAGGYRFRVRSALDVWVLKEVILDREYEQVGPAIEPGWTVVDIGAAHGEFAIPAARRAGKGRVIAVEPSPATYALLLENLELNEARQVVPLPFAIGAREGTAVLTLAPRGAVMNSTVATADDGGIRVPMLTLEGLFERAGITHCDFLKIDCEGGEYDILLPCADRTLRRIAHICLEFHEGVVAHTRTDLKVRLEAAGFAVRMHAHPIDASHGWIDARLIGDAA